MAIAASTPVAAGGRVTANLPAREVPSHLYDAAERLAAALELPMGPAVIAALALTDAQGLTVEAAALLGVEIQRSRTT